MKEKKKLFLIFILAFLLRIFLLPLFTHGDVENHVIWGTWAKQFGFGGYYDFLNFFNYARPNQPPLTIILYTVIKYFSDFIFSILWFLNVKIPIFPSNFVSWYESYGYLSLLKFPAIISDLVLGFLIYKISLKTKFKKPLALASLYLFNPISWFNSVVWGQTDSVLFLLGFSSIYLIFQNYLYLGVLLFALTFMFKASFVIFAPMILVIILKKKIKIKKILVSFLIFLVTVFVIAKPFSVGPTFIWLYNLYTKVIVTGELHVLSANAFNIWYLLFKDPLLLDKTKILGISSYLMGNIMFLLSLIFPIKKLYKKLDLKSFLFTFVIIGFTSFWFLTRMHERYLYPVFIPLLLLSVFNKKFKCLYIYLSFLNLINMYNGWWIPKIPFLINIVEKTYIQRFISIMYFLIFVLVINIFMKNKKLNEKNI
ncbi:hypothetical protein ACFL15_01735 [Patescibacteria group bacterium]